MTAGAIRNEMPRPALRAAVFSWLALLVLCLAWELWLVPLRPGSLLWLKALPIALTLPGIVAGRARTLQAALLVSMLYLLEALLRVFEPAPVRILAAIELALVAAFFCAAVAALRPLKRPTTANAAAAAETP